MLFSHDWWFGPCYSAHIEEAKRRCAAQHFPDLKPEDADKNKGYQAFVSRLEARTIIYLRDGFSYEIKELIAAGTTTAITFECMPADEAYRVGAFVVTAPYDDIVRVEIFAVHPDEKPEDLPSIKGFGGQAPVPIKRHDDRSVRREVERDEG